MLQDIRDPNAKAITFDAKSTSVRDVQFNPFYSNYFGAAFDNGTVQVPTPRIPAGVSLHAALFLNPAC